MRTRPLTRTTALTAAVLAVAGLVGSPAQAAQSVSDPDVVSLLSDMESYWTPKTFVETSDETKAATAYTGDVKDAAVLGHNDEIVQSINAAGSADQTQAHRALIDADYDWKQTLPDSLGPVLGEWFSEGVEDGSLPLTTAWIDEVGEGANTGNAKKYYNYPRPYLESRGRIDLGENANDMAGLADNLGIHQIADWTDPATGLTHTGGYGNLADMTKPSQAFPSGHTTYAYSVGIALAEVIPELAPEVLTRSSEAGNNRIVLGVHYPLDVMGGRITASAELSARLSDPEVISGTVEPAQAELESYLEGKCEDAGYGDTLEDCIDALDANDAGGYTNAFTDVVSTSPVTDRVSALAAYRARMTYGFTRTGITGQDARVPEGAEDLLVTAFPTLTDAQRRAVLAAVEIDSGYPLDSSSLGWQRVDLAAPLSAKVVLDLHGTVVDVVTGQDETSVVVRTPNGKERPYKGGHGSSSHSKGHGNGHGAGHRGH